METDVLIVGAGPSGAVTALRLAQEGFKVTVLEQGDWPDYSKAQVHREDFPLTAGQIEHVVRQSQARNLMERDGLVRMPCKRNELLHWYD